MTSSLAKSEHFIHFHRFLSRVFVCVCCHIRHSQRPLIFYIWNAVKKKPRKLQEKNYTKKRGAKKKNRRFVPCLSSLLVALSAAAGLSLERALLLSAAALRAWSPSNTRTQTAKHTHVYRETHTCPTTFANSVVHMYMYVCKVHRHQGAADTYIQTQQQRQRAENRICKRVQSFVASPALSVYVSVRVSVAKSAFLSQIWIEGYNQICLIKLFLYLKLHTISFFPYYNSIKFSFFLYNLAILRSKILAALSLALFQSLCLSVSLTLFSSCLFCTLFRQKGIKWTRFFSFLYFTTPHKLLSRSRRLWYNELGLAAAQVLHACVPRVCVRACVCVFVMCHGCCCFCDREQLLTAARCE